ncbi:bacteriocin immunity protein [Grimontia sp. NTOU-MAR1]|uniref:Pyocin-S2 immunity protein n=2 Tax=Grimontia marina TaxID=646534 RepID=A0A128FJH1_9GAMM|nr:bacteriocin immunity protein [Grimontia sp. NTOU-MAR1]WRV96396.1 bacteriocin immunity protein [Grimontia sp. NTOU-MAR1]CZF86943.1 Pyocin-S2 immunity protein [Grimontia marina]
MKKEKFEDYTEEEFLQFVIDIYEANGTEEETDQWIMHFHNVVGHPLGAGLIVDPAVEIEDDSPQGVVNEVVKWRHTNGLPGFKGS